MKPQDVTNTPGEHAIFMVFGLRDTKDAPTKIKELCADFSAVARSMRTRLPAAAISCIMGFGADAWSRLFPQHGKPDELEITVDQTSDTTAIFANTLFNGDGVITEDSTDDADLKKLIAAIIA